MKKMIKKICLLVLIIFYFESNIFADGECCIKYKVKITLNNNSVITGYYFNSCYYGITNQTINTIISRRYVPYYFEFTDSIELYNNIISLFPYSSGYGGKILTCYKKDRIRIAFDDIKSAEQLEKVSCHPELGNNTNFKSNGLYPLVITEFSDKVINRLKLEKPLLTFQLGNCTCWDQSVIWVLSYKSDLSKAAVKSIIEKKLCSGTMNNNDVRQIQCSQDYIALQNQLIKMDIYIFKTHFEN